MQVQAGDEQMVGGLFHVKFLKVLAEAVGAAAAAAAAALAATKGLGPGLLGTGSRRGDLHVTERKTDVHTLRPLCRVSEALVRPEVKYNSARSPSSCNSSPGNAGLSHLNHPKSKSLTISSPVTIRVLS